MSEPDVDRTRRLMAYEAGRESVPPGFPELPPIPAARYRDERFFRFEKDVIFRKSWLLAAHLDELPEPGNFICWDRAGPSVVLVHGDDGVLHAFHNRCSHRGAPVVMQASGTSSRFTCSYHGWTYAQDGELISVRESRDFPDLDKSCLGLRPVRCEMLGKLIFLNFDQDAVPLAESLGDIADEWQAFDLDNCRLSRRHLFRVRCNWKVAMEANMEVYHVPTIHRSTVAPRLDSRRNVNTFYPGGHGRMLAPIPERSAEPQWRSSWPEIPGVGEIARTATQSYSVFPNLVVPMNQYVIPPLQFWPSGIDECLVEAWTLGPDWGDAERGPDMWSEDDGARPSLVLREDIEMSEAIQVGLDRGIEQPVRLSYQEARIYYWHQHAQTFPTEEPLPEDLMVPAVLDEHWIHPSEPRLRG